MAGIRGGQGAIGEGDNGDFDICMNKVIETYLEKMQVLLDK